MAATGQISRGLSSLPVVVGKEAEVLNREVNPMIRELRTALAQAGAIVDQATARLDALEALVADLDGAIGNFTGLATSGPTDIDAGDVQTLGTSTRAAKEDHGHAVHTAAPTVGIGIGNSEGVSPNLAKADHGHALRETSGPTDLPIGAVPDLNLLWRVGGAFIGRFLRASRSTGNGTTTLTTMSDVSAGLTIDVDTGAYLILWVFFYQTDAVTTGLMVSVNFSGAVTNTRYGVLMASGATAMFSSAAALNALDSPLGQAAVGPGASPRLGIMACRLGASVPGTVALRYASGVSGSGVTILSNSFFIALQQG